MRHPDHPQDITRQEWIKKAEEILERIPNAMIYVKWTCPKCGERVTCEMPNFMSTAGFLHEEKSDGSACGEFYEGNMFGMMLEIPRQ